MDEGNKRPQHSSRAGHESANEGRPRSNTPGRADEGAGGGLLKRFGQAGDAAEVAPREAGKQRDAMSAPRKPAPKRSATPQPQPPKPAPKPGRTTSWQRQEPHGERDAAKRSSLPKSPSSASRQPASAGQNSHTTRRGQDSTGRRGAWQAFTGQAKRIGDTLRRTADENRAPRAGEWRASDFDERDLDAWDRQDEAPFEVPRDPDGFHDYDNYDDTHRGRSLSIEESRAYPARAATTATARRDGGGHGIWDDEDEWDAGWETGTWDTSWAAGEQDAGWGSAGSANGAASGLRQPDGRQRNAAVAVGAAAGIGGIGGTGSALAQSLNTLAQLAVVGKPIGRIARVRLLIKRRPAAAAILAFFLLGFVLTCCAPLIPVLRLGYDTADAYQRVLTLQTIFSGGSATVFNTAKLQEAQAQVDGITHDLYEINGAMNIIGAPLAGASNSVKNYRLLLRVGFDLASAADEGLGVAQTILTPLQGGALASDTGTPGFTQNDITQAQAVLADASVRVDDAIAAYQSIDPSALPSQLKPGSRLGKYLALLPTAQAAIGEMNTLLGSIPALLGVGQPAYYLVIAMDRTELRPGGGFQGNYGILELDGGKQSKQHPLALTDVYKLDHQYYENHLNGQTCIQGQANNYGPQPPNYYWWWPVRGGDPGCQYTWGLRDSNLSPDFPSNARTAMQIASEGGAVPNHAPLQGVITFSPVLIEDLLQVTGGSLYMPQYKVTVTPKNLEKLIHEYQLGGKSPTGADRKAFTHYLSSAMLNKIKGLHGKQLTPVLKVAEQALAQKDLQLYFADPRAELILQQLGLASQISTGNGDGFYVVDTNDGGNKANAYVNEYQADYVTLLPNGGALHRLQIAVTYKKTGSVYSPDEQDYNDVQRTYLPGDAAILGYSGFTPDAFGNACGHVATLVTDCAPQHIITGPSTMSDVPGRTMVMGPLTVACGENQSAYQYPGYTNEKAQCDTNKYTNTQTIYIEWYTPHAFTINSDGHGTYSELVEKQPGSSDFAQGVGDYLTVYVDASQLHSHNPQVGDVTHTPDQTFAQLTHGKKPIAGFNNSKLLQDTVVSYNF